MKDEEEQPEKMIVPHSVLSARNRKRVVFVIVTIVSGGLLRGINARDN